MEAGEGIGQALVVADEAAEAGGPGEGAFDHPSFGQEHEAALGLVMTDDVELDAVTGRGLSGSHAGVALVHEGDLDVVTCGPLNGLGQVPDLGAVIGGGRGDVQREQMAQRVDGGVHLAALLALGPVVTRPGSTFGRRA